MSIQFLTREHVSALVDALDRQPNNAIAIRDLFGVGCFLHTLPDDKKRLAGWKSVLSAMGTLMIENGGFNALIRDNLDGNEYELAQLFQPHKEILELFDHNPKHDNSA